MAADDIFWDGFDTYGPTGMVLVDAGVNNRSSTLFASEWTSVWVINEGLSPVTSSDVNIDVATPLSQTGQALQVIGRAGASGPGVVGISKTLPASYERIMFGGNFMVPTMHVGFLQGIVFGDGGSDQVAIVVNDSGLIEVRRASSTDPALYNGTVIATSVESVTTGVGFSLKGDITFGNSGGIVKIWLNDELTSLNLTGIDTQNTTNASANTCRLMLAKVPASVDHSLVVDDFYLNMFLAGGSGDVVPAASLIVETQFPTGDNSIAFSVGATILGADYSETDATNAPGANELVLRSWTPDVDGTLESVTILPEAASGSAKFKMVAYADSAGVPGSLLSAGPEVVGCTAGTMLTGTLTAPQTLVAGTPVWIGFITDTSIALALTDDSLVGRKIANTYGSGTPSPAGAMTSAQPAWVIFGNVSGVTDAWSIVDNNPFAGDRSYMVSSNVNDQDLFGFPILSSTPTTIYGIKVLIEIKRSDAGARTIDIITKSAATTDAGDNPGVTPPTTYGSRATYQLLDPDTSAAWNASGVNSAWHGYKIAS